MKILGSARPGETIRLHAEITGRLENLLQARASATLNGNTIFAGGTDPFRRSARRTGQKVSRSNRLGVPALQIFAAAIPHGKVSTLMVFSDFYNTHSQGI